MKAPRRGIELLNRNRPRVRHAGRIPSCPACGENIPDETHAVHLQGQLYHARCALYRPRHRALTPF